LGGGMNIRAKEYENSISIKGYYIINKDPKKIINYLIKNNITWSLGIAILKDDPLINNLMIKRLNVIEDCVSWCGYIDCNDCGNKSDCTAENLKELVL
jgi:hypothetical protein